MRSTPRSMLQQAPRECSKRSNPLAKSLILLVQHTSQQAQQAGVQVIDFIMQQARAAHPLSYGEGYTALFGGGVSGNRRSDANSGNLPNHQH
ncbi:hypothetical protein [Azospirillum sp. sgz301742]